MTSPGVENTQADASPGHQRQESKDSQVTLNDDGANAAAKDERRSRKRAVSDGSDDDEAAHEAKRFRVTAEPAARPTTATTAANTTGLPTAAAPQTDSIITTAAPAVVDNHHEVDNEPDEVQSGAEADTAAPVEGGGCDADEFSSSGDELEDEGPSRPFCEWNVVGPARLGYDQFADWVDQFGMAWRLDVVPAPRLDAAPQHYAGFPSWAWTNLGHVAQGFKHDTNYVDAYGNAWLLTLFRPARPDGGRVPRSTTPAPGHAGPSNEVDIGADKAPSYDPACCCCRGCCCCPLAADDEAADAPPRAGPSPYRLVRLGPVHLGFNAHYVDRYGNAWRREPIPVLWSDVDEASSEEDEVSSDDEAQETLPVDDKRSDAGIDDDAFEDAGAVGETDAEDDGSDGSDAEVEYEDEDELEYAD